MIIEFVIAHHHQIVEKNPTVIDNMEHLCPTWGKMLGRGGVGGQFPRNLN